MEGTRAHHSSTKPRTQEKQPPMTAIITSLTNTSTMTQLFAIKTQKPATNLTWCHMIQKGQPEHDMPEGHSNPQELLKMATTNNVPAQLRRGPLAEVNWPMAKSLAMACKTNAQSAQISQCLPMAEAKVCIGWLLYLAPKSNGIAISQAIKQATGVQVKLQFCTIKMTKSTDAKVRVKKLKALHLAIDCRETQNGWQKILQLYASNDINESPLGLQMHLIPTTNTSFNTNRKMNAHGWQHKQKQFLAQMETLPLKMCMNLPANCSMDDDPLHYLLVNISHPVKTGQWLFLGVSQLTQMTEILIRYHGQHRKIDWAAIHQIADTFGGQRLDDEYPSTTYPTGQERGPDTTGSSDWEQFLAILSIHSGPLADTASQVLCIWSSQPPPAYIPHPMSSPHQCSKQEQLEDIL